MASTSCTLRQCQLKNAVHCIHKQVCRHKQGVPALLAWSLNERSASSLSIAKQTLIAPADSCRLQQEKYHCQLGATLTDASTSREVFLKDRQLPYPCFVGRSFGFPGLLYSYNCSVTRLCSCSPNSLQNVNASSVEHAASFALHQSPAMKLTISRSVLITITCLNWAPR